MQNDGKIIRKKINYVIADVMQKLTTDEEIEQVKSNLSKCKTIVDALDLNWINEQMLQKMERSKVHALFWLLLDKDKSQKLDSWLRVLKTALPKTKFQGLINKIKKRSKEIEFYSLLSEIEVVSYYANKGYNLEYEPAQGDLKLILSSSEIFIEIARLFPSQEEQRIDSLAKLVWSRLDDLDNNRCVITFEISPAFSESDVEPFIKFASSVLSQEFKELPSEKFDFEDGKASITVLSNSKKGRGYIAGDLVGVMEIHSSSRLKNKILDEISQLLKNKLNVIVYNVTHYFADFDDIEDAFYGQLAVRIYKETMKTEPFRKENGVIHEKKGEQVSAIIAYEDFNYEKRRIYPNPKAKFSLSQEFVEKL